MLCEECKIREATVSVVVRAGNESTTRHLCAECVAKMNAQIASGRIMDLLSGILSAISGPEDAQPPRDDVTCPCCGTTLHQFLKSGKLGCAGCYDAFREQLQPMLLRIHGRAQHAGRRPARSEAQEQTRSRREELSRLMAQAVAVEDFETAAQLRDQLRALTAKEGQA